MAISIPIFTSQLEKAREATDLANIRSAYAEQMTKVLESDGVTAIADIEVPVKQKQDGWQNAGGAATTKISEGTSTGGVSVPAKTSGTYKVKVNVSTQVVTVE